MYHFMYHFNRKAQAQEAVIEVRKIFTQNCLPNKAQERFSVKQINILLSAIQFHIC